METTKVGIREFRADLAEYIAGSDPVAITRHGQTVGYFIPTQAEDGAHLLALQKASKTLDQLLAKQGIDVETIISDFKNARKQTSTRKKSRTKIA